MPLINWQFQTLLKIQWHYLQYSLNYKAIIFTIYFLVNYVRITLAVLSLLANFSNLHYYIDESVLLEPKPLVDSIRHFIRDPSGVFSLSHLRECRIVQWHQVCLLHCAPIRWCIIETSLGLPRKSSAIFGNLRTSLEIFRKCSETFVWPSEKLWKIFGNLQKIITDFYIHVIKRTLHISSKIWILCSRGKNNISLVHYAHSWDFVLATRT